MAFCKPRFIKYGLFAALGLASSAFALDEYLPLAPRVMEIDLGMERGSNLGYYDKSWEMVDYEREKSPLTMPVQGKFGLIDGLEGSMGINYILQDVDGNTGFDRPLLALKYADTGYHAGGYLAIALPIGFEEVMNSGNFASMIFGLLYGFEMPQFKILANASYTINTEDEDETKNDQLHFFAKPEYPLPIPALAKHKQYLGVYLGLNYDYTFNATVNGKSDDVKTHLFSLLPGINYSLNRVVSSELTLTYPLFGKNAFNVPALRLNFYFTLEEALYNAVSG